MTVGLPIRVAFGLGSNVGDRLAHLQSAVDLIATDPEVGSLSVSSVYETAPVGGPEQPDYLNAVVVALTTRSPAELLTLARRCEQSAGRVRDERWGPRTLDVDVLAVGDLESDDPQLTLPHPRIRERAFVLRPWADVDPEFSPFDGVTVSELLAALRDQDVVAASVRLWVPG